VSKQNHVTINGDSHNFSSDATLEDVLKSLGLDPERVAIELDRGIVKRNLWSTTTFAAGAEIEIVQFVGGG
jgi:thiamine biosynthesis protein ThiS